MADRPQFNYVGEEFRKILFNEFQLFFGEENVKTKWRVTEGSSDDFDGSYMYSPETDIVVKPFNISRELDRDNQLIKDAVEKHKTFLTSINTVAVAPFQWNILNRNPRCFLSIEVGGSGSEKHLLGDMYNASVLGKIGIVVGVVPEVTKSYLRLYEYANFAYTVGKVNQSFGNLCIIEGSALLSLMRGQNKDGNNNS